MATWGQTLERLIDEARLRKGPPPLDEVRREAIAALSALTKRPTVLYASRWLQGGGAPPENLIVVLEDVQAFMEVLHGVPGPSLDLILHSPGGSPTAAEAIVQYIRTRFTDLRVIVPLAAMSAATMMACAANRIVMGKHSYLGPTDPQLLLQTPVGVRQVAAHAVKRQFDLAQQAAGNPAAFTAWIPMLQQYGPDLLVQCENVIALTQQLVREWLEKWMFSGMADAAERAQRAAEALNKHDHLTHDRYLPRPTIKSYGLQVEDLEKDQAFQDAVLTVFHATSHTFSMAQAATKIVENHLGKSWVKTHAVMPQGMPQFVFTPGPPPQPPPSS